MKTNYSALLRTIAHKNKSFIGFFLICLIVGLLNNNFATAGNITTVLRQVSINAIIAFGLTFVILSGGIDLSVGSIVALTGAVSALLLQQGLPIMVVLPLSLLTGALCGLFNGFFIAYAGLQPFITTLVSMTALRGLTLLITQGRPITIMGQPIFDYIGNGHIGSLYFPIILMIIFFVLAYYILNYRRFGRYTYAIGGNEEAARLAGISNRLIKMNIYILSGILSAVAGLILTSRLGSAQPTAGSGFELDAIAAVVVGGISLSGGVGFIQGTLAGALIIGVLNNALNLLNISAYFQMVIKGLVIFLAVLLDKDFIKYFYSKLRRK
jgi:ribose transport system permease protein